jgi:arylsulfatase A-like enzyme
MADDLGYGDLSCYGAEKIRTPHIDSLAECGVRLTDAHTPSSVCSPTRYGVLTGRYAWRGRLREGVLWCGYDRSLIELGRKTIGNLLQEKGYGTAYIGKWHLGWEDEVPVDYSKGWLGRGPKELGYDYSFVTAAAHNIFPLTFVENHKILSKLKPMDYHVNNPERKEIPAGDLEWHKNHALGPMVVAEDWKPYDVDKTYAEKATAFIIEHVGSTPERPFYLHLTPEAPHWPNLMPEFARGKSKAGVRGDHIQMLDWVVGQIVRTLKDLKIDQNTLIIFTSDNGPQGPGKKRYGHKSAGELRGYKGELWEGGHRVPFIACWPGKIEPGTQSNTLICLTDMMATIAAITNCELTEDMGEDSFNALPALLGDGGVVRESIVHHNARDEFAIRKGPWKLVQGQLFNIKNDLQEKNDIASEHPDVVEELEALLESQIKAGRTANHSLQAVVDVKPDR